MKREIDFSIFCSSTRAFGRVYGSIDVPTHWKVGDIIEILTGSLTLDVIALVEAPGQKATLSLSDVVLDSPTAAMQLARRLETECNLFVDIYDQ